MRKAIVLLALLAALSMTGSTGLFGSAVQEAGPLANGATTMMYEGVPNYPDFGRFWQICEKHKVNQFYTAPTALRALMKEGDEIVAIVVAALRTTRSGATA